MQFPVIDDIMHLAPSCPPSLCPAFCCIVMFLAQLFSLVPLGIIVVPPAHKLHLCAAATQAQAILIAVPFHPRHAAVRTLLIIFCHFCPAAALVEELCKGRAAASSLPQVFMVLAHLAATQPHLTALPPKAIKHLSKASGMLVKGDSCKSGLWGSSSPHIDRMRCAAPSVVPTPSALSIGFQIWRLCPTS